MTDDNLDDGADVQPDPVVRTALQLLPVPPHHVDFWTRLDREMDDPASSATPAPAAGAHRGGDGPDSLELYAGPSSALVPPVLRRRSNAVAAVAAVAAAVLVVVAASALVRERADSDGTNELSSSETTTDPTTGDVTTTSTGTGQPSTMLTSPQVSGDVEELSASAVLAWVDALGSGDDVDAWESLGPTSRAHFGSKEAFDEQLSGMAEGYGAWSVGQPDHVVVTPVLTDGDVTLVVVTLVGTVAPEGTTETRADAFPVRITGGTAEPEPFAFAGEIEFVVPEGIPEGGTRPIVEDDELIVVVPEGVGAPIVRLDDGDAMVCGAAPGTELTDLDEASGQRCSISPEGGVPAGQRVLTVAYASPDGAEISGQSVLFEAA